MRRSFLRAIELLARRSAGVGVVPRLGAWCCRAACARSPRAVTESPLPCTCISLARIVLVSCHAFTLPVNCATFCAWRMTSSSALTKTGLPAGKEIRRVRGRSAAALPFDTSCAMTEPVARAVSRLRRELDLLRLQRLPVGDDRGLPARIGGEDDLVAGDVVVRAERGGGVLRIAVVERALEIGRARAARGLVEPDRHVLGVDLPRLGAELLHHHLPVGLDLADGAVGQRDAERRAPRCRASADRRGSRGRCWRR